MRVTPRKCSQSLGRVWMETLDDLKKDQVKWRSRLKKKRKTKAVFSQFGGPVK